MKVELAGRTALVSGSTQGIGLAIAAGLAEAGARVVVNGRRAETVERAASSLRAQVRNAEIVAVAADLATAEGAATVRAAVPDLDILVNNLGIFAVRPALEIDDDLRGRQ